MEGKIGRRKDIQTEEQTYRLSNCPFVNFYKYFRFDLRRPSDRNQQSSSSSEDTEDIQRDIQTSRISGASSFNEDEDISPPPVTFKKVIVLSGILGIRRWMMKKPGRVGTLGYLLH